ncbi:Os10g0536450 [Oryza sativa Japonica Group]|uniref:Os10g0536450 protein n=1 Tax=Oryza sativa subsp. japonica TaxID=39947 RepID=A0A0P0XX73_ORYSJ|nr:hypothetical protein EE612_052487 [Oryza sativa]BAT11824.1 Os10g0536450 [Oryza sativa Japonica Group]
MSFLAGPSSTLLHGHRNDATDILSLSEFTTARCHTLLYFPNGHLKLVANVDDESTGLRVDGNPLAVVEDLQAGDLVVHEEDGEGVGVGVRGEAIGELRLRALWVVVHRHVLLLLPQRLPHVSSLQSKALRYRLV